MPKAIIITVLVIVFAICIPVAAQDCPALIGQWAEGPTYAVATSGDYVYFGSGPTLKVGNVEDPASPQLVGEIVLPDLVEGVSVLG